MGLNPKQNDLVRSVYRNLQDHPLEPGDDFYEPIYKPTSDADEPIDRLQKAIEWAEVESIQFFSGFRGSGKTTELKRLKKRLEEKGYFVVMCDALDYVNMSAPIDITDLLLVLAGAFSDRLKGDTGVDVLKESYWTRLKNFLTRTNVSLEEVSLSMEGDFGADLKFALKNDPSFRKRLQDSLATHLAALKRETYQFFEDAIKAIHSRSSGKPDRPVIFIVDSLEQIRGSLSNELEVIHSVESLFSNHIDALRIPYIHLIYTVPPWLKFLLKQIKVELIPSVRQWSNDPPRTPFDPGNESLRRVLQRRCRGKGIPSDAAQQLFGDPIVPAGPSGADPLIAVCGGHFRDLLLLARETLLRANAIPLTKETMDSAIASVRSNFLPIAGKDALWLDRIARNRHPSHDTPDDAGRLARFLDTHVVLYLRTNGDEWYDVHPLVRPEVERIVQLAKQDSLAEKASGPVARDSQST